MLIALCAVVGWEAYRNGEQFYRTQQALAGSTKQLTADADQVASAVVATTATTARTIDKAGSAVDTLNATLQAMNRPCGAGSSCGLLADAAKTLNTLRGTFGQVEIAANHEDRQLSMWDRRGAQLFDDTHNALGQLADVFGTANDTLDAGTRTVGDIDDVFRDQAIRQTMANTSAITGNFAAITGDFKTKFHDVLYPPPCHGWGCLGKVVWPAVREAPAFGESIYWTEQLFSKGGPK